MDKFAAWFMEREISNIFDAFISTHAHKFKDVDPSGEQKLEHTALYEEYTKLFDEQARVCISPSV